MVLSVTGGNESNLWQAIGEISSSFQREYTTVALFQADTVLTYTTGQTGTVTVGMEVTYGGHRGIVAALGSSMTTRIASAGGVIIEPQAGVGGFNVLAFAPTLGAASGAETAILAAFAAALAATGANGGRDVLMPNGSYGVGTTKITVPVGVGLVAENGATINTTTTGVCLEVLGDNLTGVRRLVLPNVEKALNGSSQPAWFAGTDTTSVGVQLNACHYEQVVTREIRNFHSSLEMKALESAVKSQNCICNTINVGQFINNRRGIAFTENTSPTLAGANQNTFIGGVIRVDGAWQAGPQFIHLYMPSAETNGNTFVGLNLEDANTGNRSIYCSSINNAWINCRFENGGTDTIEFTATGLNNIIMGGSDSATSTGPYDAMVLDAGFANKFMWANILGGKGFTLDFNSGKILVGNNSATPAFPLSGFGTNRLQIGDSTVLGSRYYGYFRQEKVTHTTGTTIVQGDHIDFNMASPTTIAGIAGGAPSDISGLISMIASNGNVTLTHTAGPTSGQGKFVLSAGVNLVMTALRPVLFRAYDGNYYQV